MFTIDIIGDGEYVVEPVEYFREEAMRLGFDGFSLLAKDISRDFGTEVTVRAHTPEAVLADVTYSCGERVS